MTDWSVINCFMPRLVNRAERRRQIIEAAVAVFAGRGYHGATMQQVADQAAVSKGGVYEYFASKQDLLLGAADFLFEELLEPALAGFEQSSGSLRTRVESFVDTLLSDVEQWSQLSFSVLRVWGELGPQGDDPLRRVMSRAYKRSADRVQAVFDRAVADGEHAKFNTRATALAMIGTLDGMVLQHMVIPEEFHRMAASGFVSQWCATALEDSR